MKLIYLFDSASIPLSVLKVNLSNPLKVFRFTSLKDIRGIYHLSYLHPYQFNGANRGVLSYTPLKEEQNFLNEKFFDNWYAEYLSQNKLASLDIIRIMAGLYNGDDVCILVGEDDYGYNSTINDSLAKYIQQVYGWNVNIINSLDDLDTLEDGDFSPTGLLKFDEALDSYIMANVPDVAQWNGDLNDII